MYICKESADLHGGHIQCIDEFIMYYTITPNIFDSKSTITHLYEMNNAIQWKQYFS